MIGPESPYGILTRAAFGLDNLYYVTKPIIDWTVYSDDILTYNPVLEQWDILDTDADLCPPQAATATHYEIEVVAKEPIAPTIKVAPLGWTDTRPQT